MMISYLQKGKEIKFLNTYSTFDSAIKGFSRDCNRLAKEQGIDSMDIAGEQAFISSMNFICKCHSNEKKCHSIKEMEKWLMKYKEDLKSVTVKAKCEQTGDLSLVVLNVTEPIFYGQAETSSQFLYDMFKKKTKNWLIDLVR